MDHVITRIRLAVTPEAAWKALMFYEDVPRRPWLPLRLLLSLPVRSEGDKLRVGSLVRCTYERGHLLKRITSVAPARRLEFEVLEQRIGLEAVVQTRKGSYQFQAVTGGTELALTTEYESRLRPRFLCRPVERLLGHGVHRHILHGMRRGLASGSGAPTPGVADAAEPQRDAPEDALAERA